MKNYDIVICGGGVIGASVAYHLSRDKDLAIAVVDYKKIGNASRASAGGLWAMGESTGLGCGVILFKTLSKQLQEQGHSESAEMTPHIMPDDFFEMSMLSNSMYPALYEELKSKHNVDFKFERTGLKFILMDEYDKIYAEKIADAVQDRKQHIRWISQEKLLSEEPIISSNAIGAMEYSCDHQINPYRLNEAYLEAARQNGVDLYLRTKVIGIEKSGNVINGVKTNKGLLPCKTVINAAGAWSEDICEMATGMKLPVFPVKGQVLITEKLPRLLNGCITTSDCYIAQKDNGEVLIGSTTEECGYDTTTNIHHIKKLAQGAMRCIPALENVNIKRCWSGLRPGSPDELPILGTMPGCQGYINACGHFRTGMLTSAITGVVINEIVRGLPTTIDLSSFSYERFLDKNGIMRGNYHLEHSL
jgi:glycine/D-amino acid oxidase-like deaminating enzyme